MDAREYGARTHYAALLYAATRFRRWPVVRVRVVVSLNSTMLEVTLSRWALLLLGALHVLASWWYGRISRRLARQNAAHAAQVRVKWAR